MEFNDLIQNGTHNLPVCSIVLQPTMLLRTPVLKYYESKSNM
jgi:hypothetical protein